MINISALPKLEVIQPLDYETILAKKIAIAQKLVPDWQPLESDEFKMILEDLAYQELHLRAELNTITKQLFLATATGTNLDNFAAEEDVERLAGTKPYAEYSFILSEVQTFDVVISQGVTLQDSTGEYQAVLLGDVTIFAGETTANGTVELQLETVGTDIKTEQITTTLPYVVEAAALEDFANGADAEDDESLRYRVFASMADKSTAGSEETYESFALSADSRIKDVKITRGGSGVVNVYYYSETRDALITTRVEEALNARKIRPISDDPVVAPATEVSYTVVAKLMILPNLETQVIVATAIESLKAGLTGLKKIGVDITLSEINNFLKVDGVKEVIITSPSQNIVIANTEIGVNDENNQITFAVI